LIETRIVESCWFRRTEEPTPIRKEAEIQGSVISVDIQKGDPWTVAITLGGRNLEAIESRGKV
jgi:hypothetical protein